MSHLPKRVPYCLHTDQAYVHLDIFCVHNVADLSVTTGGSKKMNEKSTSQRDFKQNSTKMDSFYKNVRVLKILQLTFLLQTNLIKINYPKSGFCKL